MWAGSQGSPTVVVVVLLVVAVVLVNVVEVSVIVVATVAIVSPKFASSSSVSQALLQFWLTNARNESVREQ